MLLLPALQGCFVHTYQVEQPQTPAVIQQASVDQLVSIVNDNAEKVQTLKASVTIQVSVGGARKGKVTDYTSLSGYILLRTPGMLRVLGLLPVVHTPAFDMASNGQNFTLTIPPKSKAYVGTEQVTHPSTNPLLNLRPNIFFDTLVPQRIAPDDLVYVTTNTRTYMDPQTHRLMADPEYELTIVRQKPGGRELIPERRIRFDRVTLLPSGVDIYDAAGTIQTQATYGPYQSFGTERYPSTITIRRPLEEYQIVLTFTKVSFNEPLADNQFELKVPADYTTQTLK